MSVPPAVKIFVPHIFLALLLLTSLQSCDRLKQTRDTLRRGSQRGVTTTASAPKKHPAQTGGLTIEVSPAEGITILLDDEPIADRSPCQALGLVPGPHMLEVRGMGRHSVLLPVVVEANQTLRVPVALRARAPVPYTSADLAVLAKPAVNPSKSASEPLPKNHRAAAHRSPQNAATGLFTPLWVALTAQPTSRVVVDGQVTSSTTVQLTKPAGQIEIGPMVLTYVILPGQVAALTVPHDEAFWYAGDSQIKAKSVVRVGRNPLVLRRVVPQGASQDVVLRRLL